MQGLKKSEQKPSQDLEQRFVKYYKKYPNDSLKVLLGFYKGQYHKFLISCFFFLIKHSPALFSSLLIGISFI